MEDRKTHFTAKENEGFVYIAVNKFMPHVVKIGKAVDTDKRMKTLSNPFGDIESIPGSYEDIFRKKVFNHNIVEKDILKTFHKILQQDGYRENKLSTELFLVPSLDYAKERVEKIISFCETNYMKERVSITDRQGSLFGEEKDHKNNESVNEFWRCGGDLYNTFFKNYPRQETKSQIIDSQAIYRNALTGQERYFAKNPFVYILANKYIPNLIKLGIGSNLEDIVNRFSKQTGVPGQYHPVFLWHVKDEAFMYEEALSDRFIKHIEKDGFKKFSKRLFIVPSVEYAAIIVLSIIKSFITEANKDFAPKPRKDYGQSFDPEVSVLWDKRFRPKTKQIKDGKWPKNWWVTDP